MIFNPFAVIEWIEGNATEKSANEIAAVLDSAKLVYRLEADTFIYTREILDECQNKNDNIKVPQFKVLPVIEKGKYFTSVYGILAEKIPDFFKNKELPSYIKNVNDIPKTIPVCSVEKHVLHALRFKRQYPKRYQKRIDGFNKALSEDIEKKDEYFKNRKHYQNEWIKRHLKIDKILETFNPGISIDDALKLIDVKNCPAVNLYWGVREKRMRSGNPPEDNDVDDYMFLPVVPYADIILTERNLREFILQADRALETKVFSDVVEATKVLKDQNLSFASPNEQ